MRVHHRDIVSANALADIGELLATKENREKHLRRMEKIIDGLSIEKIRWLREFLKELNK